MEIARKKRTLCSRSTSPPVHRSSGNFFLKTLGCKVNQYESQLIRERLADLGYAETPLSAADIVIVNSCTVTESADSKTLRFIRSAKNKNPEASLIVTGCCAVTEQDIGRLASMSEIDAVVPGPEKLDISSLLGRSCAVLGPETGCGNGEVTFFRGHRRAFVKIQDGCDNSCSYCKVTVVRGPSRSRKISSILKEVGNLYSSGYREIVLTGICVGDWKGEGNVRFGNLIREINAMPGNFRIRISSIEPRYVTQTLINDLSSSGKVCRHLHIPLQSGSDGILKAMNRGYTGKNFLKTIDLLRRKIPEVGISTDVITGFPGETESDFQHTKNLLENIRPSRLHVFRFSAREGTPAAGMGSQVPDKTAKERSRILIDLGAGFQRDFASHFVGKEINVLIESSGSAYLEGYSSEYVKVLVRSGMTSTGNIVRCKGKSVDHNSALIADIIW